MNIKGIINKDDKELDNEADELKSSVNKKGIKNLNSDSKFKSAIIYFSFALLVVGIDYLRYTYISNDIFFFSPIIILIGLAFIFRNDPL